MQSFFWMPRALSSKITGQKKERSSSRALTATSDTGLNRRTRRSFWPT